MEDNIFNVAFQSEGKNYTGMVNPLTKEPG